MATTTEDEELAHLFPKDRCIQVVAELNAWTSVQAILAAARHIEDRGLPGDQVQSGLIMPMPHGEVFEWIFLRIIPWLEAAWRVPLAKIEIARTLDPEIHDATTERLRAARFGPSIKSATAQSVAGYEDAPPGTNVFVVADEPFVIELIHAPILCLMDILTYSFESAAGARRLQIEARERTDGAPTIFHRSYADSRLYATLEAFCYYVFGFPLGVAAQPGSTSIETAYRAVNVQGRPPISPDLIERARAMMERMLNDLG